MLYFECDYNNGAHPEVLRRLIETNDAAQRGYGADEYSVSAMEKIQKACGLDSAQIYFLVGGTQTNEVVIASLLAPFEGVVAAETGHIAVHEAGAVEYTGHKVLTLPQKDGKICAEDLKNYLETYYSDGNYEHMVGPGMVYLSFPTELGTLYSKAELTAISSVCREYKIPLYIDGARLGYGLRSKENDLTLPELAALCDVFYIGGTKVGALCGEAVVFTKNNMPKRFVSIVKQRGAMLAKGRLAGVQFDALFTDDLYFKISDHAIRMAEELKRILSDKGLRFYLKTATNQQFVIMENSRYRELMEKVNISFWEKYDESHSVVRFCTSWATTEEDLEELKKLL